MRETKSISITRLITVSVMITLGVTILRLVGELAYWPTPWFSPVAGGGLSPAPGGRAVQKVADS